MPAFIPPYDADKVLTGVASMYWQPWSVDDPAELPADTLATGSAWLTPWVPIGATDAGLELDFERKTNSIMIEEQVTEVDELTESFSWGMNVDLAQDTLESMKLAMGGGTITATAAGTGQPGVRTLVLSTDMASFAFGYEVVNEHGEWRRFLIPKVKSVAKTKTKYSRAKDKRMWTVSFNAVCAPEEVVIREWTAPATV